MRRVVLQVAASEAAGDIGPWQEPDMPEPLMKEVRGRVTGNWGEGGGGVCRGCVAPGELGFWGAGAEELLCMFVWTCIS